MGPQSSPGAVEAGAVGSGAGAGGAGATEAPAGGSGRVRAIGAIGAVPAAVAIVAAVALGLFLRLEDPMANPVLAAEDPYTHMGLVREHLRDGSLDPHASDHLYPPGMHAVLATAWLYTGMDLYDLFRFAPAFMGAIGVLGVGLLLWRHAGRLAAGVGAVAMAVLPEGIFRTSMMAPTALDLALLPFLFLGILETLKGRLAWGIPTSALAIFLLFSHPWVFALAAPAGLLLLLLALLLPWTQGNPVHVRGLAIVILVLGGAAALSLNGCWGACGPGFIHIVEEGLDPLTPIVLAITGLVAGALLLRPKRMQDRLDHLRDRTAARPLRTRLAFSTAFAVMAFAVVLPAWASGLPHHVSPRHMYGWPILFLGGAAVVALPFLAYPAARVGAAMAAATAPWTLYNPFASDYWPHRSAVYLGLALVLLAGVAAQGALAVVLHLRSRMRSATQSTMPSTGRTPRRFLGRSLPAIAPALLAGVLLCGGVYAGTPAYEGGWYRMYDECGMGALRDVAKEADRHPEAVVILGSWQAQLVVAALAEDATRVWYSQAYFANEPTRAGLRERPVLLALDPHRAALGPHVAGSHMTEGTAPPPAFLADPGWQRIGSWCDQGEGPAVTLHLLRPVPP